MKYDNNTDHINSPSPPKKKKSDRNTMIETQFTFWSKHRPYPVIANFFFDLENH